jgi:hypothetical protein
METPGVENERAAPSGRRPLQWLHRYLLFFFEDVTLLVGQFAGSNESDLLAERIGSQDPGCLLHFADARVIAIGVAGAGDDG